MGNEFISQEIFKYKEKIDKRLEELTDVKTEHINTLVQSMRYSLLSDGKRIRPFLFLSIIDLYGLNSDDYIDIACSIEMIHTYSLIHDDLPAMDDDDMRRGRPTNHIVYGDDIAILAGDALLNYSFEIMLNFIYKNPNISNIKAVKKIANLAGINGMIGGQFLDVSSENKNISTEELDFIHKNKTSALITAPILSAGIICEVSNDEERHLSSFGYNIGMAFQIRDDILDILGSEELIGKKIGKDIEHHKNTFPKYYGLEKSEKICEEYIEKALEDIEKLTTSNKDFLKHVAYYLLNRKK